MISLFHDSIITYDEDGLPIYDRPNSAAQMRKMFGTFLSNGVLSNPSNNLQVLANSGMSVSVKPGMCWIKGTCGWETETRTLEIQASEELDRIDRVVLRLNLSIDVRSVDLYVLKGTASSSPVAKTLTRDDTIFELGIADVLVPRNSTAVSQSRITDTRMNTALCGVVTGLITQVDTTTLYNQVQADLAEFQTNEQANFMAWFHRVEDILDENTAGNLLNMINTKVDKSSVNQLNGVAGINASGKLDQVPSAEKLSAEMFVVSTSQPAVQAGKIWLKPIV